MSDEASAWRVFLRPRNVCAGLALLLVFALSFVKSAWITDYGQAKLAPAQASAEQLFRLYQASFYFYYDDQFKPGVEGILKKNPGLKRVLIVSANGQVTFDSDDLPKGRTVPYRADAQLVPRGADDAARLLSDPEGVGALVPGGQYTAYFVFSTRPVMVRLLVVFLIGMGLIGAGWALATYVELPLWERAARLLAASVRFQGLRSKFIGVMILLNLLTETFVFLSQSHTQRMELTERLTKTCVLIGELTTDPIISSFNNSYYLAYQDRFVPSVRRILASKENLETIRIISRKSGMVVFDSDEMGSVKQPVSSVEGAKTNLGDEVLSELKARDTYWRMVSPRNGEPNLHVYTTYRNDAQEAPFYVEYVFTLASLKERVAEFQRQLILELAPDMLLAILVAIIFAQIVVGPIRKLVTATAAITGGEYDISLATPREDELGDLMRSFDMMTQELKRKNELRKYLSEHSYRRITEAPEGALSPGGARVRATVLFCDIRNFVNVCETLDAEEVTSLLNDYFSSMVEVIYKHKGEVDKFIGDAILAVFYEQDELKQPVNTALHAVYCAMEMRERLAELNAKRVRNNKGPVDIGIGINSGELISGPIGSADRMDFTVIGDVVNLANRIEKLSKLGRHTHIVFSNRVEERVRGLLEYEELSRDRIRGKEEDVIVFELIRIRAVADLIASLSNPDPSIKRHCIELLGYSRNREALPALYQKLSDSNELVRTAAVAAITRLAPREGGEALPTLFRQLEQESSVRVISALLISVGKLCRTSELMRVAKFLSHPDERIVANAVEALGAAEDPKIIDLLIPFVSSKSNRVKANASMVLFAKGRVEVLDTLKPMLLNSDYSMRASAAFALGELTVLATAEDLAPRIRNDARMARQFLAELQSCVPLLVSLLKDPEPVVKRQAIIALGKIKDKSSVLPLLDNLNLDVDSREVVQEVAEALRSIGSHRLVREVVRRMV